MNSGLPGGAGRYDADIINCQALVIDSNATARSTQAAQLRDLGVGTVVQCGRVQDARRHLEAREFDIVLCEQDFHDGGDSGQELLNDLRRAQLLPYSTVFVMVTTKATYAAVAEAAESALDSYLLKPYTSQALSERIQQARHRKRVLGDIFDAIDEGQLDLAAQLCVRRFMAPGPYRLYSARIGAELLMRQGRHDQARLLYEAILGEQSLPWARLGVARAQIEGGAVAAGKRTLEELIAEQPGFIDAYDVMGRLQHDQGQFAAALACARTAAQRTPGSITRQQRLGLLAFYFGDSDEATKALERAALLGISSKVFDPQAIVLLATSRFAARDSKGLQRCLDNIDHVLAKAPKSLRLQRFARVVAILHLTLQRQPVQAEIDLRALAAEIPESHFDFEAASNLLTLLAHLCAAGLQLDDIDGWVTTLGLRFCTTRSLSERLASAGRAHEPTAARLREQHNVITLLTEKAMSHSLAGDPQAAVKTLLSDGERTMNAKLIDTARMVLQHHADKIADRDELQAAVDELKRRYGSGVAADSGRQSGGVALRARGQGAASTAGSPASGNAA